MSSLKQSIHISGLVVHGEKRGRELGFPTANLEFSENWKNELPLGIYGVWVKVRDEADNTSVWLKGAASYGLNPTFGLKKPSFEVHILDFDRDLYGKTLDVSIEKYVRNEMKFDSLHGLIEQIGLDCKYIKNSLNKEPE